MTEARDMSLDARLITRRHWLTQVACGMGAWAALDLLERDARAANAASEARRKPGASPTLINPLAAKPSHFPATAKSVIFLMMAGGPSQMETFDPKPTINRLNGELMPASFGKIHATV